MQLKNPGEEKMKILLMDDDEKWLEAIDDLLKSNGHSVILCKNPEEAIKKINRMIKFPDAYLADALVRDINGEITDYFAAKTLFLHLREKRLDTRNFYIFTNHISDEDSQLAHKLGVKVIWKGDFDLLNNIFSKRR